MYNVNRVTLIGQLTADPDQSSTTSGQSKATFRVATNYAWKDAEGEWQNGVDFHRVVAWRAIAKLIAQMKKGDGVYVEGKLQTNSWVTEDGEKRYSTEVVATSVVGVEKRSSNNDLAENEQMKEGEE